MEGIFEESELSKISATTFKPIIISTTHGTMDLIGVGY